MWKWGECRAYSDELYHWGIIGQKWGVRRYQNPDGTLTAEGKVRYKSKEEKENEYKKQCLEKAIESAKQDKAHWETIVKNSKQALNELKTDKHKGDWYDDEEEKQMVIDEEKRHLSSAQEHVNGWNKALKQLNEMPVENMPIKVVKERTDRNYIINALTNDEDLNEGYSKEKAVNPDNVHDVLQNLCQKAYKDGKTHTNKNGLLGDPPKEIASEYKKITNNLEDIVDSNNESKKAWDDYFKVLESMSTSDSDVSKAFDKAMNTQNYAVYSYVMSKYPKEKAELILVWLYETDKIG